MNALPGYTFVLRLRQFCAQNVSLAVVTFTDRPWGEWLWTVADARQGAPFGFPVCIQAFEKRKPCADSGIGDGPEADRQAVKPEDPNPARDSNDDDDDDDGDGEGVSVADLAQLFRGMDFAAQPKARNPLLSSFDLEGVAEYIKAGRSLGLIIGFQVDVRQLETLPANVQSRRRSGFEHEDLPMTWAALSSGTPLECRCKGGKYKTEN